MTPSKPLEPLRSSIQDEHISLCESTITFGVKHTLLEEEQARKKKKTVSGASSDIWRLWFEQWENGKSL